MPPDEVTGHTPPGVPPGDRPPIVVLAPFVVLGLGLLVTLGLDATLADALRGGWISLEQLAPLLAWGAFALFAAVFVWLDGLVVSSRSTRPWTDVPAMWVTTALSALGALVLSAVLGLFISSMTISAMRANAIGWPVVIGIPVCLVVVAIVGAVGNVRIRRRARIVPRSS